jgi:hypothetical protein
MKAYLGIKYHNDHRNRTQIDFLSSLFEELDYSVTCITRDIEVWGQVSFTPNELMKKTFQIINESNLVVIDLTEKGVGLGIEAGYAYSRGIPIITIANKNNISTTLLGISKYNYVYTDRDDLAKYIRSILSRNITRKFT